MVVNLPLGVGWVVGRGFALLGSHVSGVGEVGNVDAAHDLCCTVFLFFLWERYCRRRSSFSLNFEFARTRRGVGRG